jgi:uncharacterized protein (UPF0332 family)
MSEFKKCLEQGKIVKVPNDEEWIEKERAEAEYDLARAKTSLKNKDHKWAIVQGYYSMFHVAKALVLSKGYREKSHHCLIVAVRELFLGKGKMTEELVVKLEEAMDLRHQADYGLEYTSEEAKILIENATEFLHAVDSLLPKKDK